MEVLARRRSFLLRLRRFGWIPKGLGSFLADYLVCICSNVTDHVVSSRQSSLLPTVPSKLVNNCYPSCHNASSQASIGTSDPRLHELSSDFASDTNFTFPRLIRPDLTVSCHHGRAVLPQVETDL